MSNSQDRPTRGVRRPAKRQSHKRQFVVEPLEGRALLTLNFATAYNIGNHHGVGRSQRGGNLPDCDRPVSIRGCHAFCCGLPIAPRQALLLESGVPDGPRGGPRPCE